ncbi:MAG: DNA-3-methyladenine glycosylase [Nitrososphaerales archaeon]
MARLGRSFYSRYTPEVARSLLGSTLVRVIGATVFRSKVVEVEAYRGADDPASHAYRGVTKRTSVMFGEPGHAYVYFTFGFHHCLNLTTEAEGEPGAVLIRAVEPLDGIEEMRRRRGVEALMNLTSGPGKLTKAMGIDLRLNGEDVVKSKELFLLRGAREERVAVSTRIGVSKGREKPWRFYIDGSPFVSGARTHNYRTRESAGRGVVG